MSGHHAVYINDLQEARYYLNQIGVADEGYAFMAPKAVYRCILLKDIPCRWANIIKQEMLSKGGEAAVCRDSLYAEGKTDVLLMGTVKHFRLLIKKLQIQPALLQKISIEIKRIIDNLEPHQNTMQLAGGKTLEFGKRTLIMGILNVTPDSFSDPGYYFQEDKAFARAMQMIEQGADIIDVGGASSRPASKMAEEQEELARILSLVKRLAAEDVIISIDTFRSTVARECLAAGAHIINDIGRLQLDQGLLTVLVEFQAPVILMHNRLQYNQGLPYQDLVSDIISELDESINQAINGGLMPGRIIIDPGIGFGKDMQQNLTLIKRLKDFKTLGKPILMGASRKDFIGKVLDAGVTDRMEGTMAVTAMSIMNGADIIRIHDVKENVRVARMTDAVVYAHG
ncbi:MAG TPA: dihydropteroate synthase [Syntrophomonadaceae bacterium]|nr:dihydropteroate synthase [Syntrophomonadaceae bacterium]HRX20217.1 dihydropteroate synthase [Syntrophomonadaceae bacterium]